MKKFLSLLGAITLTTSSASIVCSCKKENLDSISQLTFNDAENVWGMKGFLGTFKHLQNKGVEISGENTKKQIIKLQYFNAFAPNIKKDFIDFENKKVNVSINDIYGKQGNQVWIWAFDFFEGFKKFFNETKDIKDKKIDPNKKNEVYNFTIKSNEGDNYFWILFVKWTFKNNTEWNNTIVKKAKIQLL